MPPRTNSNIVTIRLSDAVAQVVRAIARAEDERASVVCRRLLRRGIEVELRDRPDMAVTTAGGMVTR